MPCAEIVGNREAIGIGGPDPEEIGWTFVEGVTNVCIGGLMEGRWKIIWAVVVGRGYSRWLKGVAEELLPCVVEARGVRSPSSGFFWFDDVGNWGVVDE